MKRLLLAAAALALVSSGMLAPAIAAAPPGPRASSENNWPGIKSGASPAYAVGPTAPAYGSGYGVYHPLPQRSGDYPGPDLHSSGGA